MKFINSLNLVYALYLLILQNRIRSEKNITKKTIIKALQNYSSDLDSNYFDFSQVNAIITNNNNRNDREDRSLNNYNVYKQCDYKYKSNLEYYIVNDIYGKCNKKDYISRAHEV